MTRADRLRQLHALLPPGASVTLTREALAALLDDATGPVEPVSDSRDLTVEEVGAELKRAPSTVRGWLIAGELRGYKLNGRDWRVPRSALRAYLEGQGGHEAPEGDDGEVDMGAWRKLRPDVSRRSA